MELFKDNASDVTALTVLIGSYELYAVRSESTVFVQLLNVPAAIAPAKAEE